MQSTLDNEVKSDMIWRPPTGLPPTLLIHPLPMYLSFLPVPSCGSPAGPGAAVGAAAQPRWGFAPPGAFPGHLPWHKTCLHLICGPATKHTKKLGQVEKLPGAQCQVCHPCVSGPAAESTWCWQTCPALPGGQPFGRHQGGRLRRANEASLF